MDAIWHVRKNDFGRYCRFWLAGQRGASEVVAKPVNFVMTEVLPTAEVEPTLTLSQDQARALFQAMWDEGFRPKANEDPQPTIAAMREHLNDMRKLVFDVGQPKSAEQIIREMRGARGERQ